MDTNDTPLVLLLDLYARMCRTRRFEDAVYDLFLTEEMQGTVHLSTGQEAVSAGVCACLRSDDYVVPSFRGHGEFLAKGGSPRAAMAEVFARDTGCARGMGGSMHLGDPALNIVPGVAIVGEGIAIAAGLALSAVMQGSDRVSVAFFGDGTANCGYFHEGLNLASIWRLPAIFICANNLYAVSTPIMHSMAVRTVAERAASYDIEGVRLDGNDVVAVFRAAELAVAKARSGNGPTLLECMTYRQRGHSRFEPGRYRSNGELKEWLARDPIPRLRSRIVAMDASAESQILEIDLATDALVADAIQFARKSPAPEPDIPLRFIFSDADTGSEHG
jgi:acetoin:2,6-dichlorophenolindophenol oxidoreductase subunit alpha